MECDICLRGHDARQLPFLCAVDARNQLYSGQFKNAQLLLENEALRADIEAYISDNATPSKHVLDSMLAQQRLAEDRADQILAAADRLRHEIQAARDEVKARKLALSRRRSDLASVSDGLPARRARQLQETDKAMQMLRFRWSQSAQDMARTRAFLCNEALRLYGLKRTRKAATGRYDYHIGKMVALELTSMDSLSPEVISTSLAHTAHILMLVSHYLAIRLPAEIALPHRDYPQPTIFNLAGSYQHGPISFPTGFNTALKPLHHDTESHYVSHPRPLFIDKPLPQLSKEAPSAYSFFLEGATLLAYDVAWLCSSQGVPVGDRTSFEDLCHLGRNMYNFLLAAQKQAFSPSSVKKATWDYGQEEAADPNANWVGRYSHGTSYYFLGGVDGSDFVRSLKLPSPIKLADKLKRELLGDVPTADWEVLNDDAWRTDEASKKKTAAAHDKPLSDAVAIESGEKDLAKTKSNGWTKLKHKS